jgi:hypothetical protein
MQSARIPRSNWDGQLPAHIAKKEQIWWEVLSEKKLEFSTSGISKFLGRIEKCPSLQLLSKVFFIVDTKGGLGLPMMAILNDWSCYCECEAVNETLSNKTYAAGIEKTPYLIFTVLPHFLSNLLFVRFAGRIDPNFNEAAYKRKINQEHLNKNKIELLKYEPGSWEKGLEISFKAAMWLQVNEEEALKEIWKADL